MDEFYDKKRKIAFYQIQNMIRRENALNPDRPPKGLVGEQPASTSEIHTDQTPVKTFNVLDSITLNDLKMIDCAN